MNKIEYVPTKGERRLRRFFYFLGIVLMGININTALRQRRNTLKLEQQIAALDDEEPSDKADLRTEEHKLVNDVMSQMMKDNKHVTFRRVDRDADGKLRAVEEVGLEDMPPGMAEKIIELLREATGPAACDVNIEDFGPLHEESTELMEQSAWADPEKAEDPHTKSQCRWAETCSFHAPPEDRKDAEDDLAEEAGQMRVQEIPQQPTKESGDLGWPRK